MSKNISTGGTMEQQQQLDTLDSTGVDVVTVVTHVAYVCDVAPVFHVLAHTKKKRGFQPERLAQFWVSNLRHRYAISSLMDTVYWSSEQ
ncbi:hypothetical protein Tco_0341602 [Tanacetum coccineum]